MQFGIRDFVNTAQVFSIGRMWDQNVCPSVSVRAGGGGGSEKKFWKKGSEKSFEKSGLKFYFGKKWARKKIENSKKKLTVFGVRRRSFLGVQFFFRKRGLKNNLEKGVGIFLSKISVISMKFLWKVVKKMRGSEKIEMGRVGIFFSRKRGRGNFKFLFKWWSWFSLGHAGAKVLNCMELFFSSIFEPASFLQNGKKKWWGFSQARSATCYGFLHLYIDGPIDIQM